LLKLKLNPTLTIKRALTEIPIKILELWIDSLPQFMSESSSEIEKLNKQILDFVSSIELTPTIAKNHQFALAKVEKIIKSAYPGIFSLFSTVSPHFVEAIISPFGSIASGIGTKTSDLDLCLFFEKAPAEQEKLNTAGERVFYLEELGELLKKSKTCSQK
jgi:DNA polymerase sigma